MSILNQKTLNKSVHVSGVGLHSGLDVDMKILPSDPNTGIVFKRIDLKKNNLVLPNLFNVTSTTLCTTVSNEFGVKVSTIEHLMASMYIAGIDNALIEINSEEVPIMDGSSKNFIDLFMEAGLSLSNTPIKLIKIENKVSVHEGKKYISIDKSNVSLDIDFEIIYGNKVIGTQKNKINVYEDDLTDIYKSRTFCLYEDIEKMRKIGLAKGGSLDNAVVVQDNKILNKEGLRNSKEFVNHKILDCMGDLYLSGYRIVGSLVTSEGGHGLTNKILRKLFSDKSNFTVIEIKEKTLPYQILDRSNLKSIA